MTQQWKPIESAPQTGRTLLLGYWNSLGKWRTVRGQWMSAECIAASWEEPDDIEAGWFETSVEAEDVPNCWPIDPTHWMPLPAAPGTPPASAQDDAKDERSDTYGMNLGERIAHVGGRTNAQGYTEFGSPMAVNALIQHVLRDLDWTRQDDDGAYQARYRLPGGQWSSWGHVVCGVKGHEQELRYLPGARRPAAPAAVDAQDDQTRWTLRWIMREAEAAKETCSTDPESPAAIPNAKLAAIASAAAQALRLVRGPSYADSGEGDAQDAARWRWIESHAENVGFDYRSGRFTTLTVAGRQGDSLVAFIDAALAAQVPQQGEA